MCVKFVTGTGPINYGQSLVSMTEAGFLLENRIILVYSEINYITN